MLRNWIYQLWSKLVVVVVVVVVVMVVVMVVMGGILGREWDSEVSPNPLAVGERS